jgi:Papain fold toxin 1, glutamine deamidase
MTQIGRRLAELGPGSSAIVGCDWADGGGHWFNAINDAEPSSRSMESPLREVDRDGLAAGIGLEVLVQAR